MSGSTRSRPTSSSLRPRPGEQVPAGQFYTVRWKTIEGTAHWQLLVEFSLDDGDHWAAIAGQVDDTGTYDWSVPAVDSNSCLVKIISIGNAKIYAVTDGTFSILPSAKKSAADPNGDCGIDQADWAALADEWLAGMRQK